MATNTMLQTLNAAAVGGLESASNRRQIETYRVKNTNGSGGTVTINAGDWVQFDSGETGADRVLFIRQAASAATGGVAFGVALDTVVIPEPSVAGTSVTEDCRVVIAGYVESANVNATTTANKPLSVDTTDGRAHEAAAANVVICGVCLGTASAAHVAPVYVYKRV